MINDIDNGNKNEEEIKIPPVGLVNFSRIKKKIKKKFNKDSIIYNSCYMNACIQCLFRLDEFVRQILKCNKGDLTMATKNLIYDMKNNQNKKRACSVLKIKQAMGEKYEIYKDDEQKDLNEFLINYLNYLTEETKDSGEIKWHCVDSDKIYFDKFYNKYIKRKGNSLFFNIFYGLLRTEEYCQNCSFIFSIKFQAFNILEIPLNKEIYSDKPLNIRDLLNDFISKKNNPIEICSICKEKRKYKTSIYSLPKCLIIYFSRDYSNNIINNIDIPISFDFNELLYDKSLNDYNDIYHLKGIIFYEYSTTNISHYKAACKDNNGKWYYFDDNYFDIDDKLGIYDNENPVFLFYEKY